MNDSKQENKESIAAREERVLKYWKDNHVFEHSVADNVENDPYVFYDGPPFATGLPHYGHLLAGTIKDIIPRYQTMRGMYVRREWGWDCHGLPLENLIEKELGIKQKREIEEYGIENFNQKARESVMMYDSEWKSIVPRMGRFVDMEKSYKTMDSTYTESIWWSFKTLYEKKLIYEGYKSMHICPRCETTLAISEVGMNYKDLKDISVYVMFELVEQPGVYMLAWTTTPWTLPGNVAIAVHPDLVYVTVSLEGKKYIVAKDLAAKVFKDKIFVIESEQKGKDLVGSSYKPVFDYYVDDTSLVNRENAWKVVAADFVTTDSGTGVVHEAPAFGEEDMELAKRLKLPMIQHVAMDGSIKKEVVDLAGKQAKPKDDPSATDVEVIKLLAAKGVLFAKEKIEHSYPFCWRCDTPLLNYAATSWFVDVTKLKPRLIEENKEVLWVPGNMRDGRFGRWIEGARDWAISRSRYWGAPLPVWKCNKCGKVEVFSSIKELKQQTRSQNQYYVMRHGEAENNVKGIVSYKTEDPFGLTEKGRAQIDAQVEELKQKKIDLVIYSPILRTKETAERVAAALGIPGENVLADERIHEVNTGDFNGCAIDTYRTYFTSTLEKFTKPSPNGETLREMKTRIAQFLYDIDAKYEGKNILLVTHEYDIWMMDAVAIGANDEQAAWMRVEGGIDYIANAEVRTLDFAPIPHDRNYVLDFHRPFVDEITYHCSCELGTMTRIPDVFDCWYESGSMPYASVHYMGDDTSAEGKLFHKNFPADFIAEGLDQTRGWFYSLLVLSVGLFDRSPFRSVIVNGLILAEDGQKMSKKLKNYPDPMMLVSKYGADALRLYLLSSPVVRGEDLRFSEKGVDEIFKKVIMRLDNVRAFYELYEESKVIKREYVHSQNILDQWIISRLGEFNNEMSSGLDVHELDRAVRPIMSFVDDLSTWYLRRSRDRFKSDTVDKEEALNTLGYVLFEVAKMVAPVMPFYAEDLYQRLNIDAKKVSVHLEKWSDQSQRPLDEELIKRMKEVRDIVSKMLEMRTKKGIKVRQPLGSATIVSSSLSKLVDFALIIGDEVNIKKVTFTDGATDPIVIDWEITEELRKEGMVRDLVRSIQEIRKKIGLHPDEMIDLVISTDALGEEFIEAYRGELSQGVRAEKILFGPVDAEQLALEYIKLSVSVVRR